MAEALGKLALLVPDFARTIVCIISRGAETPPDVDGGLGLGLQKTLPQRLQLALRWNQNSRCSC